MIVTETKLGDTDRLKIRNYNVPRQDRTNRGRGVAILLKQNIGFSNIQTPNTSFAIIRVKLAIQT